MSIGFCVYYTEVMNKLKTIELMGETIKILYKDLEDGSWGECRTDDRTIVINKKCLKDPHNHWLTLVHEVSHMIFQLSGVAYMEHNDEEAYVRCTENFIVPWVIENQDILK